MASPLCSTHTQRSQSARTTLDSSFVLDISHFNIPNKVTSYILLHRSLLGYYYCLFALTTTEMAFTAVYVYGQFKYTLAVSFRHTV